MLSVASKSADNQRGSVRLQAFVMPVFQKSTNTKSNKNEQGQIHRENEGDKSQTSLRENQSNNQTHHTFLNKSQIKTIIEKSISSKHLCQCRNHHEKSNIS
jgi:hypothetical protein